MMAIESTNVDMAQLTHVAPGLLTIAENHPIMQIIAQIRASGQMALD